MIKNFLFLKHIFIKTAKNNPAHIVSALKAPLATHRKCIRTQPVRIRNIWAVGDRRRIRDFHQIDRIQLRIRHTYIHASARCTFCTSVPYGYKNKKDLCI